MLLLQFAFLNVLCWAHCICKNVTTTFKESTVREKRNFNKIAFQSFIRTKQLILPHTDVNLKLIRTQRLNLFSSKKEQRETVQLGINDNISGKEDLVGLSREKRYIVSLDSNPSNSEVADKISKSRSLGPYSTKKSQISGNKRKLKAQEKSLGYPKVVLPVQKLYADVGVSFHKYLSLDTFHDKNNGNAKSLNIELLTSDGKKLFDTSWIKFDQSNLKLYGFPLKGNQNEHSFLLKATNSKGRSAVQNIYIIVYALEPVYNHYVHLCTTMTLSEYGGSLERRLRLSKAIVNYIFPGKRTEDVWVWNFQEGCIYLTFRHLSKKGKCDFEAIQTIENKITDSADVNSAFQQALKGITDIVSVNITVLNECRIFNATDIDNRLGWIRDIAPVFILLAVVAVPTLISCIVCREVRKRQAAMRQLQDRRMKEDREQMLIQAAEYKHECGFDSESEDGAGYTNRPSRQQEEEGRKFFGFSRIADIILPEVVLDTVKQGTEYLNTLLPHETRDAAVSDMKVSANRLFPTAATAHSTNKFLGTSQEENANSIEKHDSSLASRVKGVLNFIKSPLDITLSGDNIDSHDRSKLDQITVPESRKLSMFPAEALIPSISSIFGLNKSDGTRAPLNDIRKSMSTSIRNKLHLVMKTAAINTSMEDKEGQNDEQIGIVKGANAGVEFSRNRNNKVSQTLGKLSGPCVDLPRSVPVLVPHLETRLRISDQRKMLDSKVNRSSVEESVLKRGNVDNNAKEEGLLNRILHQTRNLLSSTRNRRGSDKGSQDDIELKDISRGKQKYDADYKGGFCAHLAVDLRKDSIKECKHSNGNRGMIPNLAARCDAECSKKHVWDCIYDEHSNPFRHYNISKNHSAQNTTIGAPLEFTPEPHISQLAVRNQELLENAGRYFVNIGKAQLEKDLSLIETADGTGRELECRPGRQGLDEKQTPSSSLNDCVERSNQGRESSFSFRNQQQENNSRRLHHYDPESGKWYPAYNSLKHITPAAKMFSVLESFKRRNEEVLSQRNVINEERIHRSNLHWYDINDNANERQSRTEVNRRKTGIDMGSRVIFDHIPANQYEQSTEFEANYGEGQTRCIGRREESIGVWTENIYDSDMDESDHCRSSDEETDLQNLIDKLQNDRSIHHRYNPNELYGSGYYSGGSMHCEQYRDEQADRSEVMGTISESDYNSVDRINNMKSFQMHFTYTEDEDNRIHGSQRDFEETQWSQMTDPTQDEILVADDSYQIYQENASENDCESGNFETLQDRSGITVDGRRRCSKDTQLHLSTTHLETADSPTKSEAGSTAKSEDGVKKQKERRRSFLERQRRVEIPEKPTSCSEQARIHLNPVFVIEERSSKEEMEERRRVQDRFDFATVQRMQAAHATVPHSSVRMRKLTYSGPFPTANIEAEKFRQQDADIIEHQTKGYLERRRQSLQHITGTNQIGKASVVETEPNTTQNRAKREDTQRRTGMRRFSTPSMESWTSTPEKYYYDATGENSISEEDVNCTGVRNEKEKKSFASGRGRAKEYTQRLWQGVSPKIRRHSTTILGQKCNHSQSGNPMMNTGTFLGKIGEGKLVQTIQTKLGKKDSKTEEPKSPKSKEKERYMEDEKQLKGSPLTAIRNTLFLFSGGK